MGSNSVGTLHVKLDCYKCLCVTVLRVLNSIIVVSCLFQLILVKFTFSLLSMCYTII